MKKIKISKKNIADVSKKSTAKSFKISTKCIVIVFILVKWYKSRNSSRFISKWKLHLNRFNMLHLFPWELSLIISIQFYVKRSVLRRTSVIQLLGAYSSEEWREFEHTCGLHRRGITAELSGWAVSMLYLKWEL